MSDDPISQRLRAIAATIAGPSRTPPAPVDDTPLVDGGYWLDSVDLLNLVLACEREFGVTFDPDVDFTPDTLRTLGGLRRVVHDLVTR